MIGLLPEAATDIERLDGNRPYLWLAYGLRVLRTPVEIGWPALRGEADSLRLATSGSSEEDPGCDSWQ